MVGLSQILMVTKCFFNNTIIQQISKSICFGLKNNFTQFQPSLRLVLPKFWPNNFSLLSPLLVFIKSQFRHYMFGYGLSSGIICSGSKNSKMGRFKFGSSSRFSELGPGLD